VLLLPFTSTTVNVTVLGPTFSQKKSHMLWKIVSTAQLSLLPLLIIAAEICTKPVESK
jgi:hypothetical protein